MRLAAVQQTPKHATTRFSARPQESTSTVTPDPWDDERGAALRATRMLGFVLLIEFGSVAALVVATIWRYLLR